MKLLKTTLVAALALMMGACGQKTPSPEEVATLINTDQTLSEADYASIIDYCGDYATEAQKYYDIINAEPNDSTPDAVRATNELANLYASYKYIDLFRNTLENTEVSALGEKNAAKVNEYAELQAFPLPVGEAADMENPDVVGMIEDMPSQATTDTAGVLSTGDGEAVK